MQHRSIHLIKKLQTSQLALSLVLIVVQMSIYRRLINLKLKLKKIDLVILASWIIFMDNYWIRVVDIQGSVSIYLYTFLSTEFLSFYLSANNLSPSATNLWLHSRLWHKLPNRKASRARSSIALYLPLIN